MRSVIAIAAVLMVSACESSPKSDAARPSASAPAVAKAESVPANPAAGAPASRPFDSAPAPVASPDSSVRRARPEEVVTGRAPLASECEGEACRVVTVTWLDPGFRFENVGRRSVAIRIWFAAAGDCLRSEFTLAPSESRGWGNTGFCRPYRATFASQ